MSHSNEHTSPQRNCTSNTANYSGASNVDNALAALRKNLRNRVEFNVSQVQGCPPGLHAQHSAEICKLNDIAGRANGSEKDMHGLLKTLFGFIENLGHNTTDRPKHKFERNSLLQDVHETRTSSRKPTPDFELSRSSAPLNPRLWSDKDGFCEDKSFINYTPPYPNKLSPDTIEVLSYQSTDYASLRTSARLFHPFSVELLIYGDKFCVTIYDRRGVELSPEHNMWNDTFLRVVRSLTCQLDEHRLGLDETVEHHFKLKGDRKQHDEYFVIQPIGDDTHYWETVGWSPICVHCLCLVAELKFGCSTLRRENHASAVIRR